MKHVRDATTFFKGLPVPGKIGRMTSTSIGVVPLAKVRIGK
jgi:hypothetical protein